jgi:lysophospholipase L1-like esterase
VTDDGGSNTSNLLDAGGVTDALAPVVTSSVGDAALDLMPSGSDLTGGPMPDPANLKYCTGTSPIHCFFGVQCMGMEFSSCAPGSSPAGAVGNYDVTFEIGGATAGQTSVEAEMHRPIVPVQATTAGKTERYAFSINARWPEGEPQEDFQHNLAPGSPQYGEQGLDLLFNGPSPVLTSIGFAPAAATDITLYVAGDSTVCDQYGYPNFAGYGQVLPQIFHLGLTVANYADSGESSASFVGNQGLWPAIMKVVKPGDVIFIEFGHNDKTITAAAFHTNMTNYVTAAKAAKAIPILLTPIARANGGAASMQFISSAGADIPTITKTVAMEQSVPVIDLTTATANWLTQVGANWTLYHAGGTDATHTNSLGAAINVGFIRDAIITQNIAPLVSYLR